MTSTHTSPPPPGAPRAPRRLAIAFLLFWLLILFASIGFKCSAYFIGWPNWKAFTLSENRTLATWPDFRALPAKTWGRAIEAWYNDNFAWRSRLIQFYRFVHFRLLHTAVGEFEVPGKDGWIFRRGAGWRELEDFLGAHELTPKEIYKWVELFEGRRQWAEAHGIVFLHVITPVKAQIHPEKLYPMISRHRGQSAREQIQEALRDSPAAPDVLFLGDLIARQSHTRPMFYPTDHHVNAYGTYLLYKEMMAAAADRLGPMTMPPFYDVPPPNVVSNLAPGCYETGQPDFLRLVVRIPGQHFTTSPVLSTNGPFPAVSLAFAQPGAHRTLVIGHDSFLRFPLYSWYHHDLEPVRLPIADGFDRILSFIFTRFSTAALQRIVSVERPALIIEQFPEVKLNSDILKFSDSTLRFAAAFSHAIPLPPDAPPPPPGTPMRIMAVLENVTDLTGEQIDMTSRDTPPLTVEILSDGEVIATGRTWPGPRRAIFFDDILSTGRPLTLRLLDGRSTHQHLERRLPAP